MKLLINNDQRLFVIATSTGHTFCCNLSQINSVIANENLTDGYYKISELWNGKLKTVSKKFLKEMYEANQIDPTNKIISIDIVTRGYWDKTNGNSYIAGWVTVNSGLPTAKEFILPFQYGDKSMQLQFAYQLLSNSKVLPTFNNSQYMANYIRHNGIVVNTSHADGYKQSDLKAIN